MPKPAALVAMVVLTGLTGCGSGGSAPQPTGQLAGRGVPLLLASPTELSGELDGDDWLLIVSSAATGNATATWRLNGGEPATGRAAPSRAGLPRDSAPAEEVPLAGLPVTRTRAPQQVGDTHPFSLPGAAGGGTVTATLRYFGPRLALFVDNATPAAAFDEPAMADLGGETERRLLPRNEALFGAISDVDGDGRLWILFTPAINRRGYGLFTGADLSGLGGNGADMFYVRVPETHHGQTYAEARGGLLATIAHEMQHLINYHHKALRGLPTSEQSWLNEGLSFVAEDLNGLLDSEGGTPENVAEYLAAPDQYTLLLRRTDYDDGHAGADYLFVRYLVERFGESVLARLVDSDAVGTDAVAEATGVAFSTLFRDWAVALWLNGISPASSLYHLGFDTHGSYPNNDVRLTGPQAHAVDAHGGRPAFGLRLPDGAVGFVRLNRPASPTHARFETEGSLVDTRAVRIAGES